MLPNIINFDVIIIKKQNEVGNTKSSG